MAKVTSNFSADQDTQPIDSLPSSPSGSGKDKDRWLGQCGDEFGFLQDTVPFEDDSWIKDQYMETQAMDFECNNEEFPLCAETQAVHLDFEAQEESLAKGKQSLEASDGLDTQVLDHLDDDEVADDSDDDFTDLLEDKEFFDADDSCSGGRNQLPGEENKQDANEKVNPIGTAKFTSVRTAAFRASAYGSQSTGSNQSSGEENKLHANEKVSSVGTAKFASVRTAAFRASAMSIPKSINSDCSTLMKCHSSDQGAKHNTSLENSVGEIVHQSISVGKSADIRSNRTARKLFLEDSPEKDCPSVAYNVDLANLSYIDSQEPGEATQASALNLVDKIISESCLDFALEVEADCRTKQEEKSKNCQSVKGPQHLAKKLNHKGGAVGNCIFEWDDNLEDEGGGDIYRRRKDELFGVITQPRGCSTLPREQKREMIHDSQREVGVAVDKRVAHSDSRLLQCRVARSGRKIEAANKETKKSLVKEFDDAPKDSNHKLLGAHDVVGLGPDTQEAAEAINALCSRDCCKIDDGASCLSGKKLSPGEERGFSRGGAVTRQSKGTKRIQAMSKNELLKTRMKKARLIPAKPCGEKMERSSKDDQLDKEGWKSRKLRTAPRKNRETLVNELDEVSKECDMRMLDRLDEVDVGPDTQMAAEAISALHSGDVREIDPEPGKKLSQGGGSSSGVVTRQSKRIKGIQVLEIDFESLKPKTKKARSVLGKACVKNIDRPSNSNELDTLDENGVSNTGKRRGGLSSKHCTSKILNQPTRVEAEVSSYPKRRRSARISHDQFDESGKNSHADCDTPVKSNVPLKNVSPICMGDEYLRLSCKDSLESNTSRELRSLTSSLAEPIPETTKGTRKRRDLGSIRVLFSQHLDEDVTNDQKKILARFGILEASSMMEATHFIADNFMRTRNMLEAIASGKPVVTTQWLESIDQVKIYVDEDLYLLRDSKKEREFGFSMGVSLARARQRPLLQGRRVFITPNTKPGMNTITTLVKAVHGQPVERLGRSVLSEDKIPDNLLVLSCEEDYNICLSFLERGAEVYSSELLLNGIVTQKLEYERYRLFREHVRRTRSTLWLRDGKGEFQRRSG